MIVNSNGVRCNKPSPNLMIATTPSTKHFLTLQESNQTLLEYSQGNILAGILIT